MTELNIKKNSKKNNAGPNKPGFHFNYALIWSVISLVLISIAFGALYFISYVEIKELKSELNSKLSKTAFLSEKEKIENTRSYNSIVEKEFLLSKIKTVNDLVKTNSEDLGRKIDAARVENLKYQNDKETKGKNENINKGLLKNQINTLKDLQVKYKSELGLLRQRIYQNQELIEENKKSLSLLRSLYQNTEKKQTLQLSQELVSLLEEFSEISYYVLKNEIESSEKENWKDWIMSYLNTVFISRSTQPIDGDHTDAVLSRIDHALKSGKLSTAKKEINNLSFENRALLKDWIQKLENLIEIED